MTAAGLLRTRRFLPLFATQALGAFNDNLFRSAMLFLIAFRLPGGGGPAGALAASLTGAVFILPFLLFSSAAGRLVDGCDKAAVARAVKLAELAILGVGAAALLWPSLPLLYLVLFAMGTHSAVFGPVKYAILPQHLGSDELIGGTALVEAATFLAILGGQIAGGLVATPAACAAMIGVALAGVLASRFVPAAPPLPARTGVPLVGDHRALRHATIGISWFYALGGVLTQQFVPLVAAWRGTPAVAALLLALFSLGVAVGSLLAVRLPRATLPAALALALLMGELAFATAGLRPGTATVGVAGFVALAGAPRVMADLVGLAIAGGVYVVPLYARLQTAAAADARARAVAGNNIANALAMVAAALLSAALLKAGGGVPALFGTLAMVGLLAAWDARQGDLEPSSSRT